MLDFTKKIYTRLGAYVKKIKYFIPDMVQKKGASLSTDTPFLKTKTMISANILKYM